MSKIQPERIAESKAASLLVSLMLLLLVWLILPVNPVSAGLPGLQETETKSATKQEEAKPATQEQTDEAAHADEEDHADEEEHADEDDHAGEEAHADGDKHHDEHSKEMSNFDYFLNQDWLISHVQDSDHFTIPGFYDHEDKFSLFGHDGHKSRKLIIPQLSPYTDNEPLYEESEDENVSKFIGRVTFQPTKFIVLMLFAAAFVFFLFVWLANKIKDGNAPQGRLWNALEAMIYFVRDDVAKPSIGSHDYKKFLPFLLTTFFFILTMNLMGMFPLFGTPTSNISVTASLALVVFLIVLFTGMKKLGVVGFWKAQAPHVDVDGFLKMPLTIGIWAIEVFGLFIKHMVLAVRLFANMFAGHLVLAVLIAFIGAMWGTHMNWVIVPGVLGSSIAINILELLVAFIQAYVFTFLTALFIGAAAHPH
ncbi:MAG: F0F1 ATP synthase subunit A [Pirellulaceae bacterium]|nr:F0F1 ATP synthase subunit A [Pirellulaceae bacterium]MDG2103769.1 F0F1 ATP synthase subunit A [Pirellulaceae bacterium]